MSPMLARRTTAVVAGNETMLHIEQNVRRGRRGDVVRLIQEWLCLHDFGVMIDGRYGSATEQAVMDFQGSTGVLPVTGEVDPQTYAMLIRPMTEALRTIEPPPGATAGGPSGATIGQMVAAYALQHLRQQARETGGANRGPWVRLYLHGDQRPRPGSLPQVSGPWCAGFVSTMIAQATATLGAEPPLDYQTNVNHLAEEAIRRKRFISGDKAHANLSRIPTGSLLLLRKDGRRDEWHHTGVVTQALPRFVRTIEGNAAYSTEEEPSGNDVCRQMRSYGNLDFIVLDGRRD